MIREKLVVFHQSTRLQVSRSRLAMGLTRCPKSVWTDWLALEPSYLGHNLLAIVTHLTVETTGAIRIVNEH